MATQFRDISNSRRISKVFRLPEFDRGLTIASTLGILQYAIKYNIKVDFFYEDDENGAVVLKGYRSVSPVALGTHITSGNLVFRAYVIEGVSKSKRIPKWRLFRVDRVKSIHILYLRQNARFNSLYRPNDKHIGDIIQEAEISQERKKLIRKRKTQNT